MADKKPDKGGGKKGDKKPAESARPLEIVVAEFLIICAAVVGIFFFVLRWFGLDVSEGLDAGFMESFKRSMVILLSSIQTLSAFVSLLFIMGIIYAKFKMGQVVRAKKLQAKVLQAEVKRVEKQASTENRKWKKVLEHVSSDNSSDWRLAILEADILLGELLTKSGYKGEGIGEQLKSVEPSDFQSLQSAWEAHKVRNRIAHDGADHPLSQREAKRVIGLFEEVFREFYYI